MATMTLMALETTTSTTIKLTLITEKQATTSSTKAQTATTNFNNNYINNKTINNNRTNDINSNIHSLLRCNWCRVTTLWNGTRSSGSNELPSRDASASKGKGWSCGWSKSWWKMVNYSGCDWYVIDNNSE